jgi:hypothetical protein
MRLFLHILTLVAPGAAVLCAVVLCAGALPSAAAPYEDATIHVDLPSGWEITGEAGEYQLESEGQEIASLLILSAEPNQPLGERLAEIEEQFLSTGIISLEEATERIEDGESIHCRRYRLTPAGESDRESDILLHQYSFWRAGVQVLLQIETAPEVSAQEDLFFRIFQTLEIHKIPAPFIYEDLQAREN